MRFVDAYASELEKYARHGLQEALAAGAHAFHVDWAMSPFFSRAHQLARYWDEHSQSHSPSPYADTLRLPDFPFAELSMLASQCAAFFVNDEDVSIDQRERWWECAFDQGPYVEAGMWIMLMVDASIARLQKTLQAEVGKRVVISFCGHDGWKPLSTADHLANIQRLRDSRGHYAVDRSVITGLIQVMSDTPDPSWLQAAEAFAVPQLD